MNGSEESIQELEAIERHLTNGPQENIQYLRGVHGVIRQKLEAVLDDPEQIDRTARAVAATNAYYLIQAGRIVSPIAMNLGDEGVAEPFKMVFENGEMRAEPFTVQEQQQLNWQNENVIRRNLPVNRGELRSGGPGHRIDLLKGFEATFQGKRVYAKGISFDRLRVIENYLRVLRTRTTNGKRVTPTVLRVYFPNQIYDMEAMEKTARVTMKINDRLGAEASKNIIDKAAEEGLFELVELKSHDDYAKMETELNVAVNSLTNSLGVHEPFRAVFVSEWGGDAIDHVLGSLADQPEQQKQVAISVGQMLGTLHREGIVIGDPEIDEVLVNEHYEVTLVDLENVWHRDNYPSVPEFEKDRHGEHILHQAFMRNLAPVFNQAYQNERARVELRKVDSTARNIVDLLNPKSDRFIERGELRQYVEIIIHDYDEFDRAIQTAWEASLADYQTMTDQKNNFDDARLANRIRAEVFQLLQPSSDSQVSLRGSVPSVDEVILSSEITSASPGTLLRNDGVQPISLALKISDRNSSHFLEQLVKILSAYGRPVEILGDSNILKQIDSKSSLIRISKRYLSSRDWINGIELSSDQDGAPLATDGEVMTGVNEMFGALIMDFRNAGHHVLIRDFSGLLFAKSHVLIAEIRPNAENKEILKRLKLKPLQRAEFIKAQLLKRLPQLEKYSHIFTPTPGGHLNFSSQVVTKYLTQEKLSAAA
jgi:hypothetical protein